MEIGSIITSISFYIGAVTGVVSLFLHFRQLWTERFALKIYFYENENIFFDRLASYKNYRTKFQGVAHVRFVNKSATPLTIYAMTLFVNGQKVSTEIFKDPFFSLTDYLGADGHQEFTNYSMEKQINLPLRLEAYDSYDGMIFIPHFPSTDDISQSIKLRVETPKGSRTKFSTIWIHNTVVDDGDGPYIQ